MRESRVMVLPVPVGISSMQCCFASSECWQTKDKDQILSAHPRYPDRSVHSSSNEVRAVHRKLGQGADLEFDHVVSLLLVNVLVGKVDCDFIDVENHLDCAECQVL